MPYFRLDSLDVLDARRVCQRCGLVGKHETAAACIARLRDIIADRDLRNLPPPLVGRGRRSKQPRTSDR